MGHCNAAPRQWGSTGATLVAQVKLDPVEATCEELTNIVLSVEC